MVGVWEGGGMKSGNHYGLLGDPMVKKLDSLPEGLRRTKHALTQPNGWYWANNGRSIFSGERETALVREGKK